MSVDRFEYPDLALTVERGKVGYPSTVTLDGSIKEELPELVVRRCA